MEKIFWLLISVFSFTNSFSQDNDKFSFISADKLNIVYRGFPNPLTILVPNSKSFEASAPGLVKISENKYILSPGPGLEVKITLSIILKDDSHVYEEHVFKILNMKMQSTINGQNCDKCIVRLTKKELENAKISFYSEPINDFFGVGDFRVFFSESESILVKGNTIDHVAYKKIKDLEIGTILKIDQISYDKPTYGCISLPKPILVMIVEEE